MKVVNIFRATLALVWCCVVLAWPVLKWLLSLDVLFQFSKMVYFWGESESNAGWVFAAHFFLLSTLTYMVAFYKPRSFNFSG